MTKLLFPSIRIGLCLAALTVSVLLVSDQVFDIVPDQAQRMAESRRLFCESISVQFSSFIERDDLAGMRRTMNELVNRNEDVESLGLRLEEGNLLASTQHHKDIWDITNTTQSTLNQVRVPIYKNNNPWGTVEVKFIAQHASYWKMILQSPLTKLVVVMLTVGLFVYTFFIRRTLRMMDPGSVVPHRVKAALDQLVEGVVLLDEQMGIALANNAFLTMTGKQLNELVGHSLSSLNWQAGSKSAKTLPWEEIHSEGGKAQGSRLMLKAKNGETRILSCNVAAINDGKGKQRGLMASFDDISTIELTNNKLRKTISQLEDAEKKIRSQNKELRMIASIDPLTGVMNRGAFFDKLNTEFMLARQEGLPLSCIMADIDYFKNINDTYGHATGDEVIKGMANILTVNCNTNGAVGRYGGEEFCLVLPGVGMDEAMKIAEKIRSSFAAWSQQESSPSGGKKITSSFGISAIDLGAANGTKMVDQADKALYVSKTNGRNRVTRYFDNSQVSEAS